MREVVELRAHRAAWCIVAALLGMSACAAGDSRPPTEEQIARIEGLFATMIAEHIPPTPSPTGVSVAPAPSSEFTEAPTPAQVAISAPRPAAPVSAANVCLLAAAQYPWDMVSVGNIVWCESRGDPWAVNPSSGACGCFQHLPCEGLGDAWESARVAYEKYVRRGWQPWTVGGCWP